MYLFCVIINNLTIINEYLLCSRYCASTREICIKLFIETLNILLIFCNMFWWIANSKILWTYRVFVKVWFFPFPFFMMALLWKPGSFWKVWTMCYLIKGEETHYRWWFFFSKLVKLVMLLALKGICTYLHTDF